MEKKTVTSAFRELWESIQYMFDSKKGKYSLETYLGILSEYTDRLILAAKKDDLSYTGGECRIKKEEGNEYLEFHIEMFFLDKEKNAIKKEAARKLPVKRFTTETLRRIDDKEIKFEITSPKEEKR